jgi:hypothetical protein
MLLCTPFASCIVNSAPVSFFNALRTVLFKQGYIGVNYLNPYFEAERNTGRTHAVTALVRMVREA